MPSLYRSFDSFFPSFSLSSTTYRLHSMAAQHKVKHEMLVHNHLLKTMEDIGDSRPKINPASVKMAENRRKAFCGNMPVEEQLTRQGQYYEVGRQVGVCVCVGVIATCKGA